MKIEHAQSPEEITGCVKLDSPLDKLREHFSSPPLKHLHIVVQLPPMREYACHSFMLSTLLLMLLCFFTAAPYTCLPTFHAV